MNGHLVLANMRNGLAYPHGDVCNFQSNYAHQHHLGYFRLDSMPYRAVIHLLKGGTIEVVDATARNKPLSDALKYGVPTWMLVFNRALRRRDVKVCNWQTREMQTAAWNDDMKPLVNTIRKLARLYEPKGPLVVGENVLLTCHRQVEFDDNIELLKSRIHAAA